MRQEILTGVERRRRWSIEEKLRVLGEVGLEGASVSDVARRNDITRQHLYQWRGEMRRKGLAAVEAPQFLPVELSQLSDGGTGNTSPVSERGIEIGLRNGRIVRAPADMPENLLMRVIRIAENA